MNELCPIPGCRVDAMASPNPDHLDVDARGIRPGGCCPECGRASRAVHSHYRRHPFDLPSLGRRVRVSLRVRRFYCHNPRCARRTFAEWLPELVLPHARRTCRLAAAQSRVGVALGGEAGARLLRHLAMPTSADTVLRLVRLMPLPEVGAPRIVALDDWAIRKGQIYGTVVVDLERRRVIDLLPDRTSATVAGWLRQRPGVEVVARDRFTEYARAGMVEPVTVALPAFHQDQVITLPPNARVLAASDFTPYAALGYDDDTFSIQGHPEFSPEFSAALIEARRDRHGPLADAALLSLWQPDDGGRAAAWLRRFVDGGGLDIRASCLRCWSPTDRPSCSVSDIR